VFARESTLLSHTCEKKRRWQQRDDKVVKIGFYVFQRFYELNFKATGGKRKTFDQFIDSPFYSSFVGFGKYLRDVNAVDQDEFITHLIRNNFKQREWTDLSVYRSWIRDHIRKEPAFRAFERGVVVMTGWASENDDKWFNFFRGVNTHRAVIYIQHGHISPWLVYLEPAVQLLSRLSDSQMDSIQDVIDPEFWTKKMQTSINDVKQIATWCKEYGV
jgi:hypothetical protein